MRPNYQKAIDWIKERLNEEDINDFKPEAHITCKSLHLLLKIHLRTLETGEGFVLRNAYYQTKKLKDWWINKK